MFKLKHTDSGKLPDILNLPAGAITPKYGMALYLTSGKLAVAAGSNKPTHICMAEYGEALTAGTPIPVMKITPEQVWESVRDDASSNVVIGSAYDVATGGLKVDVSSTTNGCFVIDHEDAKANGAPVVGRFKL